MENPLPLPRAWSTSLAGACAHGDVIRAPLECSPEFYTFSQRKAASVSATTTMVCRGGASLVQRDPVFSKDGKRLLVCTSCTVTVFSVQTGEVLTVLKGHKRLVTSVVVVPIASICHCWTAGLDGTLRFWDFAAGVLLRTLDVNHPVQSMVIPELCKPREEEKGDTKRKPLVAFLSVVWTKEKREGMQGRVICYNITAKKQILGHLAKTPFPELLQASPSGGVVGMVDDHKAWVWLVPQTLIDLASAIPVTILHHTKRMSVLAFDTTDTRVAVGDVTGRILVWENVGDRTFSPVGEGPAPTQHRGAGVRGRDDASALTTHHWHAHEVKSLLFTIDGVYLLSGGQEGVLVIWQLDTGKRNYLPRLGGPVLSIRPSLHPSLVAIACTDNSIKLLNLGTMDIERTIQGIHPDFALPKELTTLAPCLVSIEPAQGKVVVATHNLSLQFYDAATDTHVAEVQVGARNHGSDSRDEEEGPSTCVTHVAFSGDGGCMATVDVRLAERSVGGGSCLKFWDRDVGNVGFSVNTQVDEPHEISALSFRTGEMMAVSCSDSEFKVWVPYERRAGASSRSRWRCRSVGSYRQRPILAASFSPDGTILAVAASEFLTLWNPVTNGLIRVLSNSVIKPVQAISHLAFVKESHCLVAASSGGKPVLTVWDIATLSVRWSLSMSVVALSVDPVRPSFAVLGSLPSATKKASARADAVVALFDLDSPSPKQYWTVRDGSRGSLFFNPVPATSLEGGDKQSTDLNKLTFLTSSREFVVFDPNQREEEAVEEEAVVRDVSVMEEVSSAFAAVYGNAVQAKKKATDAPSADVLSALSRAPWGTLLNGPSHVLPPLSVVAVPFMDSLLVKRKEQS